MDNSREQVEDLLRQHGAVLVRQKKHRVWKFPDRRIFVTATSPSDAHAWNNSLRQLKAMLGQRASSKTQADFEHQKKEEYRKPVKHRRNFLEGLPDREERPPTPVSQSPLLWLKEKKEKEAAAQKAIEEAAKKLQEAQEEDAKIFSLYGNIPSNKTTKKVRRVSGMSGRAVSLSEEQRMKAQDVLDDFGEAGLSEYLNNLHSGQSVEKFFTIKKENGEMNPHITSGNPLEDAIREAKEKVQLYKAEENKARLEWQRFEKVAEALEQALKLSQAPRASVKGMLNISSNGHDASKKVSEEDIDAAGRRVRGTWRNKVKEIILTSPTAVTRMSLRKELEALHPEVMPTSIYQTVWTMIKSGFLSEVDGVLTVKEE